MTELMRDSLVLARNLGMDVFNALNLMQNQEFLQVPTIPCRAELGLVFAPAVEGRRRQDVTLFLMS